jgi:hypothetical protein
VKGGDDNAVQHACLDGAVRRLVERKHRKKTKEALKKTTHDRFFVVVVAVPPSFSCCCFGLFSSLFAYLKRGEREQT